MPALASGSETIIEHSSLEQLRDSFTLPQSRFATVDGVIVHYMEQGTGPVILLLHGSYLDLTSYDEWAVALEKDHKVIRIDRLRFGLTGTFPGQPVDYEREQKLLVAFVAKLNLTEFSLAGASSGGIVAAEYAAHHPEQIKALILMNVPLAHGRIQNTKSAAPTDPLQRITTTFEKNIAHMDAVSKSKLLRYKALHLREDPAGAVGSAYDGAAALSEYDRLSMFAKITARTLVIWSEQNKTLALADSERILDALGSPEKYLATIAEAGHMVPFEMGAETASMAHDFLLGNTPPKRIKKHP